MPDDLLSLRNLNFLGHGLDLCLRHFDHTLHGLCLRNFHHSLLDLRLDHRNLTDDLLSRDVCTMHVDSLLHDGRLDHLLLGSSI